jgi:hypothetical protein
MDSGQKRCMQRGMLTEGGIVQLQDFVLEKMKEQEWSKE